MAKDFWTRQIRLEEISQSEYYSLRQGWSNNAAEKDVTDTYARMVNPIAAEDYESLITTFLKHPAAKQITVFEPGRGWCKFAVDEINPAVSRFIAELAENDPFGYNNFEMRFQPVQPTAEGIEERAKIIFCEVGDLIVGYRMKVHRNNLPLFDSQIRNPRELIVSAIADPAAYKH